MLKNRIYVIFSKKIDLKKIMFVLIIIYFVYEMFSYLHPMDSDLVSILMIDVDINPVSFIYNNTLVFEFSLLYCILYSRVAFSVSEFGYTYEIVRSRDRSKYFINILKRITTLSIIYTFFYFTFLFFIFTVKSISIDVFISMMNYILFLIILSVCTSTVYLVSRDRNISMAVSIISYITILYMCTFIYYFNLMYEDYTSGIISLIIRFIILIIMIYIFKRLYLKADFM